MSEKEEKNVAVRSNISEIKNKQRRAAAYKKLKMEKLKVKKEKKKAIEKLRNELGEEAVPKQIPKTIENQRVFDETKITESDDEIIAEAENDSLGIHLSSRAQAKVLITTTDRPLSRTNKFCKELKKSIPFSEIYYRRGLDLKKITDQASKRGYTALIVVNEDRKTPNGMIISHLPNGPTASFRLSNVVFGREIKRSGELTDHLPELILNNFTTTVGNRIGRLFATLYPRDPDFHGRRVVTFHNQRDYIFFRQHRYQFRNEKRVGLQELGPRFTLKLRTLQDGTFDSKFGDYEFIQQKEKCRRKFSL
ncbi:hypothetical protein HELRODRAFT_185141 [Helobdella robusta]|uniref:Brix domain-containing protein n=1 Tax=Helobdella robusta TaxID=6412 RepID=T1FMG1_HELRO|nr:hypothetical protein HELRODRAFT_185141 [Helobdella robusta]ESN92637.1 hypothetical protein HELRODRAFT_185141 [Helobdella robusta]